MFRGSVPSTSGGGAPTDSRSISPWKIWLPVLALFLVADLGFHHWFWRIPKISIQGADWGYQFMHDLHRLQQPKPAGVRRVLALGSSVSGSFDPRQVEGLLQAGKDEIPAEVHRLMLPGIHHSDYLLLFESVDLDPPDVIVVMFNLVDFLFPIAEREINPTLRYILPPLATWRQYSAILGVSDGLDLGLAAVSDLYRYRRLLRSAVQDHVRAARRWLASSPPTATYGIHPDGYTERRFGLTIERSEPTLFEYYVHPAWLRQQGDVLLTFRACGEVIARRRESQPGWKGIELNLSCAPARLDVEGDSAWSPRVAGLGDDLRLVGVQLRQPPASLEPSRPPFRYRLWEEGDVEELMRIGGKRGAEFERGWQDLLESDTRFGERFRHYRDAKLAIRDRPFVADDDYAAIAQLVELFRARGSRVLLVNTPESPLLLSRYEHADYYTGYREFFATLAESSGARFVDLSGAMAAEDFNDWHHLHHLGAIELGPRFAEMIAAALEGHP